MAEARYTLVKTKIPVRDEEWLDRFSLDDHIAARAAGMLLVDGYDQIVPGLYPDEKVYELDTGDRIALSVETYWQENNAGPSLHGYARCINEDGSTKTTFDGKHVEVAFQFNPSAGDVAMQMEKGHTVDDFATDLALIMLGEEPKLKVENVVNEETGETIEIPWIRPSGEGLANANVRFQLDLWRQTEGVPKLKL